MDNLQSVNRQMDRQRKVRLEDQMPYRTDVQTCMHRTTDEQTDRLSNREIRCIYGTADRQRDVCTEQQTNRQTD